MSKHTPGPWIHYDDSEDGKTNRHEIAALGKTVAHIYCSVPSEDRANARLIAAAPDLLAACTTYATRYARDEADDEGVEHTGCARQQHEDAKALFAAIAKATGEPA